MGTFQVSCLLQNHVQRKKTARVPKLLVDTGSEYTWISKHILKRIGITTEKKDVPFLMANGQTVTWNVGFAIIRIGNHFTVDEVVFAQKGDLQLLGARTLEGMNLTVDSRKKKLVAAGPVPAASCPPSRDLPCHPPFSKSPCVIMCPHLRGVIPSASSGQALSHSLCAG